MYSVQALVLLASQRLGLECDAASPFKSKVPRYLITCVSAAFQSVMIKLSAFK